MDVSKTVLFQEEETTEKKCDANVAENSKGRFPVIDSTATLNHDVHNGDLTGWRGLGAVFKSQFSREMIFFRFRETPDQFVKCHWSVHPYLFLVYRVLFTICIVGYTILSATKFYLPAEDGYWKWPLYITSWLELISSIYSIVIIICYVKYYFIPFWRYGRRVQPRRVGIIESKSNQQRRPDRTSSISSSSTSSRRSVTSKPFATNSDKSADPEEPSPDNKVHQEKKLELPYVLKLCWFLYNASMLHWLIRIILVLFVGSFTTEIRPDGLKQVELIYCFFLAVEQFMVSIPIHILHLWVPLLYQVVYLSFIVIYAAAGGTGRDGRAYVMKSIDYKNKPLNSIFFSIVFVLSGPVPLQLLGFTITCFRDWLHYKLCK